MSKRQIFISTVVCCTVMMTLFSCTNPFAPPERKGGSSRTVLKKQTHPDSTFSNMDYAFNNRDIRAYEDCLDETYWWSSPSESGVDDEIGKGWGRAEDVRIAGKIFDYFTTIQYTLHAGQSWSEYGKNVVPENLLPTDRIVDEHPDEVWQVYLRPVELYLFTDKEGLNGFFVQEYFEIKMRKNPKTGLWVIVRWIDHAELSS